MSLRNPFGDLGNWQFSTETVVLPDGLRYGGYDTRVLRAQRSSDNGSAAVQAPTASAVRRTSVAPTGSDPGIEVVELTPLAFRFRHTAQAMEAGLPIFYFLLPAGSTITPVDQQVVGFGEVLANVSDVRMGAVFPDRLLREPSLWANMLLQAIDAAAADNTEWQPFASQVSTQIAGATDAPVLLMNHAGRPLTSGSVNVSIGSVTHVVGLTPGDQGDLQAAIARLHVASASTMPIADLWDDGATSVTLQPVGGDAQLVRLEDGVISAGTIAVTPASRHVMLTDLHSWFAPQFATPNGAAGSPLARYTRGNHVTPLVNGHETFTDLFMSLKEAGATANGALHLAGWAIFAEESLAKRPEGDAHFPETLVEAATRIGAAGGTCRFLGTDFVQVSDPSKLEAVETLALFFLTAGELLSRIPIGSGTTDGSGLLLAFAVLFASPFVITYLQGDDFKNLESNQPAVDVLNPIGNCKAVLSPLPFTIDDNPLANPGGVLHGAGQSLFDAIRHFGVYHQKLAIVRRGGGFLGYCGGIDCNPDRLDDQRHLNPKPYHDVHARIEGPAVRDLAITFDQRWQRDGGGTAPAFTQGDVAGIPNVGEHVVQVARTYGTSAAVGRQLSFAPNGDRTILDTMLAAIGQAREFIYIEDQYLTPSQEYLNALTARVSSGELRKLIIAVPDLTDQPYGEVRRTEVITALRNAAVAAGDPDIVRIGSPRRRFTVPHASLRASSGRLFLKDDIVSPLTGAKTIALGPPERIPEPPFWIAVDGEFIWVYDESVLPNPNPGNMKIYQVEHGDATRILSGVPPYKGPSVREHKAGTPATLVHLDGIYVHSKLIIVDDVFLGLGSANLNRRGFYSDGECNVFVVPEALRGTTDNPVRALRKRLWAEMLDLPLTIADPLLEDPVAASTLFDRSYFLGNRFVRAEAFPSHVMVRNWAGGDGLVFAILNYLGFAMTVGSEGPLFDTVVDPTSSLDPGIP
jgi:phosphatidylserine/phosphatidylglycerophosphate/cardiolipin synthase-like enzyme